MCVWLKQVVIGGTGTVLTIVGVGVVKTSSGASVGSGNVSMSFAASPSSTSLASSSVNGASRLSDTKHKLCSMVMEWHSGQ